jgi:uncharacterized protein (DUF3820 family)
MMRHATDYGNVVIEDGRVIIDATGEQLAAWAERPGQRWPCSELAKMPSLRAEFDTGGLVDLSDASLLLAADEFNAWSSDVLRSVLPTDHGCYLVTVGQFA